MVLLYYSFIEVTLSKTTKLYNNQIIMWSIFRKKTYTKVSGQSSAAGAKAT